MPDETNDLPSLEALSKKIDQVKPDAENADDHLAASDYSLAFRFITDLFSGVVVGGLIGYGIDSWLDSLPWALVVGLILGMVAGIRNMMRSAREIEEKQGE